MATTIRDLLLCFGLCGAVAAQAATEAPPIDVIVTKGDNAAVAYRGKTDGIGKFATGALQPGAYVVLFTSKQMAALKGSELSIDIDAGRKRMTASAVPAEKFGGGGVAMKVEVARASKLSGQVASAATAAAASAQLTAEEARANNVKIFNGRRHVWVPGGIETRMGGRWVEEGSEVARLPSIGGSRTGEVARGIHEARGPGDAASYSGGSLEIMDKTGGLNPNPLMARAAPSDK